MDSEDYLQLLKTMEKLPFSVGRKALSAVLAGDSTHETVQRHQLHRERYFGCLSGYSEEELKRLISWALNNNLAQEIRLPGKFYRVLDITPRGRQEIKSPTLHKKQEFAFTSDPISPEDEKMFDAFGFFLKRYNAEQKKAIVTQAKHVLCIAGPGSGKTTVLTKRIEFLVKFRGVPRDKILAITFTRKARQEMQYRLNNAVQIETFNSFCERLLIKYGPKFYGKPVRMVQYKDKVRLLHHAVKKLGLDMHAALNTYFTTRQRNDKTPDQLTNIFLNDCFGILDYYANNGQELQDFSTGSPDAKMVYNICRSIKQEMKEIGLRDYSDQLMDTLKLLRKFPEFTPRYEHILIDEYQDVNAIQQDLLAALRPGNLFAVGDPRQSIFGWRGSSIQFILTFPDRYTPATIVVLQMNYRSGKEIVDLINVAIEKMQLPPVESHGGTSAVQLCTFHRESDEFSYIAESIKKSKTAKEDVFVLTRTNKQLQELSSFFRSREIPHAIRNDEGQLDVARPGEVTLSTVHAIKGLEASTVFVVCCNAQSYPCVASDHSVLDLVKKEIHDREEEELRLLYVAMSRAKRELVITYTGNPSIFITSKMRQLIGVAYDRTLEGYSPNQTYQRLRDLRSDLSRRSGLPAYMIFSDKTLHELAARQPTGLADLQDVPGIGPAKIQKYGEALLQVLHGI